MKKFFTFAAIVFLFSAFYLPSYGQLNAEGLKVGLQFNGLMPFDDSYNYKGISDSYEFSYLGRGFFRFDIAKGLQGEIGGGYGRYQGKDFADDYNVAKAKYVTDIIPIDFRLLISLKETEKWNPYVFIGGGGLHYDLKSYDRPNAHDFQNPPVAVEEEGWTAMVPAGLGTKIKLTETILLEVQASFTYTFTENLNFYKTPETPNDAYVGLGLGLTFQGDRGTSDDDMDGLMKKEEKLLGTDPKNPDTDSDGLSDYAELITNKTDPLKADTDGDGLKDGEEVTKYKTDPLKADTDGDGLKDGEEITNFKTDPLKKDTDGGTVDDGVEVKRGTNPLNADDDVVKVGVPMILEGVTFATGKADITPESAIILEQSLKTMNIYPEIEVEIGGHTDTVGKKSSNVKLSQKRADSVKDWLVSKGVDSKRITTKGYGPDQPIVPNDTPENKRKNRRIGFTRTK